jgi:SET domain-containing protein
MLKHLKNKVYCRIAPSPLHGVGVFAVRRIPKGADPFEPFVKAQRPSAFATLTEADVRALPRGVSRIVRDFYAVDREGFHSIPIEGPNALNISFYVNESASGANVTTVGTGASQDGTARIVAARAIRPGEELLLDYREYDDDSTS